MFSGFLYESNRAVKHRHLCGKTRKTVPFWEITYPVKKAILRWLIFLFQRWDMLVPHRYSKSAMEHIELAGDFKHFYFHPDPWGRWTPCWRAYFSDGLVQPPTTDSFSQNCRLQNRESMGFCWMLKAAKVYLDVPGSQDQWLGSMGYNLLINGVFLGVITHGS